VTVTFVTRLGLHSVVFVRRSSNVACEILKNTFSHLIVISVIDVNIGVNVLETTALLVCK